jgi:glycerophosphoryl diester phosphodiesterase
MFSIFLVLFLFSSCQTNNSGEVSQVLTNYVEENGTLIVAHRGYAAIAPENTISSFEAALDAGAKACEFDVQISSDNVLVVIHDNSVDRTTNGEGKVNQLTYDYLATLDAGSWKDPKYKGEKIPTLLETLTFLKENDMIGILEIKADNIVDEVLELVYETKMEDSIIIISFSKSSISKLINRDSTIPAVILVKKDSCMTGSTLDKVKGIEKEANKVKTKYIGPYAFQLEKLDASLASLAKYKMSKSRDPGSLPLALDEETLNQLHEDGYFINVWTVDNEDNMRDLISNNIDMLTTNYVEKALKIKDEINNSIID